MRVITQRKETYTDQLDSLGLELLEERRLNLIDKFVGKALGNSNFADRRLPVKERNNYNTRREERYVQYRYDTERARKSPLNFFRTRLNKQFYESTEDVGCND